MAFTIINLSEIEVGDPVTASLMAKVKGNDDDHEARIVALEGNDKRVDVFNDQWFNPNVFSTLTGLEMWRASQDFTLTEGIAGIFLKGSLAGTFEIDIKKSPDRDPSNFVTVFTTKPSITFASASDYDDSVNGVYDNTAKNVTAGDYLRLDITQMPTGGALTKFYIHVYGEV